MSSKTILDTLKAVTGELGFSQPIVVVSSQVLTDIQLKYLAIASGDELLDAHDWQALIKLHTVTIDPGTSLYDLPTDYHRMVDTTALQGQHFFSGAASSMSWTRLKSGEKTFRVIGNKFEVFEPAAHPGALSFYYISKHYVIDGTNDLPKAEFTLDSDTTVYHARLFTTMVKLKMLQTKNLDSRAAAEDYNSMLEAALSNDTPSPVLDFDGDQRLEPRLLELS